MIWHSLIVAVATAAALSTSSAVRAGDDARGAPVPRETVAALAGIYSFGVAVPPGNCRVTLHGPTMHDMPDGPFSATMNAACRRFAAIRALKSWMPTGGASIRLLGGNSIHTLGEFSPAQDGSGVYLRGGVGDDGKVYELRQAETP